MTHRQILEQLNRDLEPLRFALPVTHVYNPLIYARAAYLQYAERYGQGPRPVVLLGMNPGPWGMVQTGVPFGDVTVVTGWLGLQAPIGRPAPMHPKRPVEGFACRRNEVSGRRLWGWARDAFRTPEHFFQHFFVANYCPLVFMESSGRNRTPDKLPVAERRPLEAACDRALMALTQMMKPGHVIGVGAFAAVSARRALAGTSVVVGQITHPSPANPKANRDWAARISAELTGMGLGALLP
ncbi:MAG: single-stranded DNA-binding protein [Desulfobacterales bacterium]|jgi:single-strand selective monofunctional uracil DNA glycosylase|nr:single-stranded DNA-binding protein [Desulfobacteraceae bacterium]MDY0313001.1 single-stranded DNA-binding protein [Desulfobacterales bacterium]